MINLKREAKDRWLKKYRELRWKKRRICGKIKSKKDIINVRFLYLEWVRVLDNKILQSHLAGGV